MTDKNQDQKDPRLVEAELQKAQADAIAAEYDLLLKAEELKKKKEERKHQRWLNKNSREVEKYNAALENFNYGLVRFIESVRGGDDDSSVERARSELRSLAALRPGQPIRIELNSGGGSVYHGLDLFDEIRRISEDVRANQTQDDKRPAITTVITGRAASMAGILAQAGDWRVITKHSWLHLHSVSYVTWGKAEEIADDSDFCKRLTTQGAKIFADRAKAAGKPISTKKVKAMFDRRELWLNAKEALNLGFVDEVA